MGEPSAKWNLLQLAFVAVYPACLSSIRMVDGMALLALYVFLFILCIPPMFIQHKLGGYEQKGIVGLFSRYLPIAKGVGVALLIDLFLTCVYFAPLVCHFGMYAVISMIQEPYLWEGCSNAWNTDKCVENLPVTVHSQNEGVYYNRLSGQTSDVARQTPEKEFFNLQYLQITDKISDIRGFPVWNNTAPFQDIGFSVLPVGLTVVWLVVFLIVAFGGRVCGWILFVMCPGFLGTLFAVLVYGYMNLDKAASNQFLGRFYNLNFDGFVDIRTNRKLITDWEKGFSLLMNSFPVWTAIPATLGKMTGRGKVSRNLGWLLIILVYACIVQVPQLAMAPYLGNLLDKTSSSLPESTFLDFNNVGSSSGIKVVFQAMPAAFSILNIPKEYAMLFFLSLFLSGVMFLSVGMLTIVDNICDSLFSRSSRLSSHKIVVNFVISFVMIVLALGAGFIHMTQAGMYYTVLMDQSVLRLRFITVALLAFSIIIVYVRNRFAVAEKVLLSIWCILAAIGATGFWLYSFIITKNIPISYAGHQVSDLWELISWLLAGVPYIAIPAAAIHSCMLHEGDCSERSRYLLCGGDEDDDDEEEPRNYDGYFPTEPTAPPYSYMDPGGQHYSHSLYPVDDLHKATYDPEMEPLNSDVRTSRI
ncbi:sodium- and chloride-dependent GABA transporter 2-like isoform X2 [Ylistrum balloti]|uniref:sodium- and chloride-dependent GABA transporter 2-like isoform X2 n=1 Tax=Ylistrum balloti TaxID=509963 RepID=UPI002905AA9A|nr:sodium- and chloride-dependent GABA transporter 2-like isoform X2 [Ylistrum balloti]